MQNFANEDNFDQNNVAGKKQCHGAAHIPSKNPVSEALFLDQNYTNIFNTVKPLIKNTSKEYSKCRILHFLIMECCRYLVF